MHPWFALVLCFYVYLHSYVLSDFIFRLHAHVRIHTKLDTYVRAYVPT